jgi:hypothetical protein
MQGRKPVFPGTPAGNALVMVGDKVQRSLEAVCGSINRCRREFLRKPVTPFTEIVRLNP